MFVALKNLSGDTTLQLQASRLLNCDPKDLDFINTESYAIAFGNDIIAFAQTCISESKTVIYLDNLVRDSNIKYKGFGAILIQKILELPRMLPISVMCDGQLQEYYERLNFKLFKKLSAQAIDMHYDAT